MASEMATLGGGCFWCIEPIYQEMRGVVSVKPGYAGGDVPNPTYEQVCGKRTGHAEVIQVEFDPAEVSYANLLRVFFTIHDPTTPNQQGADHGPQYRSIVLTHSDEQGSIARQVVSEMEREGIWPNRFVTEIKPLTQFWVAEPEHHDYYARNPSSGYCRAVVTPKIAKFRKTFADRVKKAA